jgi:hypothetical protein
MDEVKANGYFLAEVKNVPTIDQEVEINLEKDEPRAFVYAAIEHRKFENCPAVRIEIDVGVHHYGAAEWSKMDSAQASQEMMDLNSITTQAELANAFDNLLSSLESGAGNRFDYAITSNCSSQEILNLLDCGSLLRKHQTWLGINTPYAYVSLAKGSPTSMHIEDANLRSLNLLLSGATKLWIVVPESERAKLEAAVRREHLRASDISRCSQFIRHCDTIFPTTTLRKWGIAFQVVRHNPGELMFTNQNAYHQVLNYGPNFAIAINVSPLPTGVVPSGCTREDNVQGTRNSMVVNGAPYWFCSSTRGCHLAGGVLTKQKWNAEMPE